MKSSLVPLAAVIALLVAVPQARAAEDAYVSQTSGADVGTCPINAPCATITYALTQVAVSGDVIIVDSGDYAPFTITQTVQVRAIPGVFATVTAPSSGTAVTINATTSSTVTLSDLHIFGFGQTGATGVHVNSAGKVQIYGGSVSSFSGTGIVVAPSANGPSGNVHFVLSGTNVGFNNAGNVLIEPTAAASVIATIREVFVHHSNGYGFKFDTETTTGAVVGNISNSNIAYHGGSAINAHSPVAGGVNTNISVNHSVIHFNSRTPPGAAVYADGASASIVLNFSEIEHTTTAWGTANGGKTFSYGNNAVNNSFNMNASSPTNTIPLQ